MSRETVMAALLERLKQAGDFKTIGRRLRSPESLKQMAAPALFLVEAVESYRNPSTHQPPIRRMLAAAMVYTDVGDDENAIPATAINNILDEIDVLLKPDNAMSGQCTLGGLVQSVVIEGTIQRSAGEITGRSAVRIPLSILLP